MKTRCRRVRGILPILLFTLHTAVEAQCFDYVTNQGTITITRYNCSEANVVIPATINGLPVTTIGDYAFYQCTSLTSVTIPDSVTTIGNAAFYSCSSLTSVTIPDTVITIADYAFEKCASLTNVTIGTGVNAIGFAFAVCASLAAITVDPLNPVFSSTNGVLFKSNQTILVQCPGGKSGAYSIPDSVTSIADAAFLSCTSLTSVTIPNSVTTIGAAAFEDCTGLTNVTIGNGVTTIGIYAFTRCTGLISVTIGNSVTIIGYGAFHSCSGLGSVAIPNSVTTIRDQAFIYCSALTSVTIPNSVTTIGNAAFLSCTSLASVTIPNSVVGIGAWAFFWCINLTSVTIPTSLISLGSYALSGCTSLTHVCFQGSPPILGEAAFHYSPPTIYYLPGTAGWGPSFGSRPTVPWHLPTPVILNLPPYFGRHINTFSFRTSWATNASVVIEASPNLTSPAWTPLATNALTDGWCDFTDSELTNHPARFYRVRSALAP